MRVSIHSDSLEPNRPMSRNSSLSARFAVFLAPAFLAAISGCTSEPTPAQGQTDAQKRSAIDAMYGDLRPDFSDAAEISVEDLLRLQDSQEVLIVDVREPEERAVSIIPGAVSKEVFETLKADISDEVIIVHCTIGYRSGKYVERLKGEGIDAFNLKGSILSWVHAGQPVVDPEGNETKRVHVYGEQWNLLPEGYEAVW